MASGDTLTAASPLGAHFPASDYATIDFTAAPDPVLDFDDTTSETAYWKLMMSGQYDGSSSINVVLAWKFTTFVGSQTCDWEVSFYRIGDDTDSVESYTFATAQTATPTEASAPGEVSYDAITFTNAQADGIQGGEWFILRVTRDATGGTASPGDAELSGIAVELA